MEEELAWRVKMNAWQALSCSPTPVLERCLCCLACTALQPPEPAESASFEALLGGMHRMNGGTNIGASCLFCCGRELQPLLPVTTLPCRCAHLLPLPSCLPRRPEMQRWRCGALGSCSSRWGQARAACWRCSPTDASTRTRHAAPAAPRCAVLCRQGSLSAAMPDGPPLSSTCSCSALFPCRRGRLATWPPAWRCATLLTCCATCVLLCPSC